MKYKRKVRLFAVILITIILFIMITYYFQYIINPVIYSVSEGQVRMSTVKAVNDAIAEVVSDANVYESLCNVITDEQGNVSMISANALRINNLTKELIKVSQQKLEDLSYSMVHIPLGNFTGIPLFSGMGPDINIRVVPMGSMSCNFVSEFSQAGINQTNHKIFVNFSSYVNVVMPLESRTVTTSSQILICECIIVGKVPQVYLNSTGKNDLLNLVP